MPPKKNASAARRGAQAQISGATFDEKPPIRFDDEIKLAKSKRGATKSTFLGSLTSFGVRLTLFYTLFAALWSCSKEPFSFQYNSKDKSQVCRTLAQSKAALQPHYTAAWKDVQPWVSPYVEPVAPYYRSAVKFSSPHLKAANKRGQLLWKAHGEPARKHLIKQAHTFAAPHIKTARGHYKKSVKPHVDTAHATIKPYQDIYRRDVHPYVLEAQTLSAQLFQQSLRSYRKDVHPRLLSALALTQRTYVTHVDPAIRRGYSVWVRPQVEKVLERLFQRKAHAVGTEAIDQASSRAKDARSEGETRASQAVEAAASARRAQEDPTLLDRLNKAKDAISGKKPSHEDPVQAAALDAELDAELETVKKELEAWEDGMLKLIEKEYGLVTERLAELRNGRLADLPDRFASLTESFVEDEVASALSRLERNFRKISNDKSIESVSKRVERVREETNVQKERLAASRAALEASLDAYAGELEADEEASVQASVAEVKRFSDEAGKFFVKTMDKAKFAATEEEWEGWASGLSVRAEMYEEELEAVRIGERNVRSGINATDLAKEPQIPPRIGELRKSAASLYTSAVKELDRFAFSAQAQIRGEGVQRSVGEATDAVAERAEQLSEQAAAAMLGAAAAARARLGLAPKNDGILARVSAKAGDFAEVAGSQATGAAEQVRTAVRSAASALGATPSPEGAREHAESLLGAATDQAASFQSVISEKASSASAEYLATKKEPLGESLFNAATSSVGEAYEKLASQAKDATAVFEPSSTGYAEGLFNAATSSVGEAYERAASAASDAFEPEQTPVAQQIFDSAQQIAQGAAAAGAEHLANAGAWADGAQDAAISQLHSATRSAASAAGYKPTPETPGEYAEQIFDGASSAYGDAVNAAAGAYSNAQDFASRAGEEAISRLHTASRSAASVVGATPSPESAADYAEKIFDGASKAFGDAGSVAHRYYTDANGAAGEAQDAAISALHSATRSAASAAGYKPTPESAYEYLENAKDALFAGAEAGRDAVAGAVSGSSDEPRAAAVKAKQVDEDYNHVGKLVQGGVDSVRSAAAPVAEAASSIFSEGSENIASVASPYASGAADALSEAGQSVSSIAADASGAGQSLFGEAGSYAAAASQSVVSAAGGEVKPTDLAGTASSLVSQATAAVLSGASDASAHASSVYASVSSATRSEKKQQGHSVPPEGAAESAAAAVGRQAEAALEKLRAANAREERKRARGVRHSDEL